MLVGAAEFQRKLDKLADGVLSGDGQRRMLLAVGKELAPLVDASVRAEIGDLSLSHWARGKPVDIHGQANLNADGVEIKAAGKGGGPLRNLQSGRQSYAAGDRRNSGTYVSKKTGERKQKTRKVKRNTGAHGGRGVWDDAVGRIHDRYPGAYHDAQVSAMGRLFVRES